MLLNFDFIRRQSKQKRAHNYSYIGAEADIQSQSRVVEY